MRFDVSGFSPQTIFDMVLHGISHTLSIIPFLFLVYFIIEILNKNRTTKYFGDKYAPLTASLFGMIPQCGFSVACASLYNRRMILGGTLIAVLISTSDEFLPILVASIGKDVSLGTIIAIIGTKIVFGAILGLILNFTIYKNQKIITADIHDGDHCCHHKSPFRNAIEHTLKVGIIILLANVFLEVLFGYVDIRTIQGVLMTGSIFQPILSGLIGLVPGCCVSVFVAELFLLGSLSLGSVITCLSCACGFSYLVMMKHNKKDAIKIISIIYVSSVLLGIFINIITL